MFRSAAILLLSATLIAQGPQPPTIRTNTQLVIVDVTVTDAHQNPIHNLKASDFVLLEDNVAQNIKSFDEHAYIAQPAASTQPPPALPPGVFTNLAPVVANNTLNILLLDTLNTPMQDQQYARNQIRQYLKNAPAGTRIAIFGLGARLYLLQGFTSNPEVLKAAIDQKNAAKTSPLLGDDTVGGGNGSVSTYKQFEDFAYANDLEDVLALQLQNLQQFEADRQSTQNQLRASITLNALNQLARYLSAMQGRKNLIWFSGSFPINILPDGSLLRPFSVMASAEDEFRQTTNLLARSQVAVYPVDSRGVITSPTLNASNTINARIVHDPRTFGNDENKFYDRLADDHSTMLRMAEQTGGRAFINTNDLNKAVADVVENGASYYTLTYTPANAAWDGAYRKIEVRTPQGRYKLSYRRGYFADAADAQASRNIAAAQPENTFYPMRAAMMHGAPEATQIIFRARVVPASATTEDTLAPGVAAGSDPSKLQPPYRRYNVVFAADPRNIRFTPSASGNQTAQVQFVTYVYSSDGQLIARAGNEVHADLPPASYTALFHGGLRIAQQISVPDKGNYYLRVGIHDIDGDHAGALELPIAAVRNLPPEPTKAAPPQ